MNALKEMLASFKKLRLLDKIISCVLMALFLGIFIPFALKLIRPWDGFIGFNGLVILIGCWIRLRSGAYNQPLKGFTFWDKGIAILILIFMILIALRPFMIRF